MASIWTSWALIALAQQNPAGSEAVGPATWADFYQSAAKRYEVVRTDDRRQPELKEHAVFNWASIDDFHGAMFAWTENGRPTMVATIFSFPVQSSKERQVVHEFGSFAVTDVVVKVPDGTQWNPPAFRNPQRIPDAPSPAANLNGLRLQCRQLTKEFSAHMNRRGERWDLRLLPAPLVEYQQPTADILGGGLFSFVGYATDPEILLLLEARRTSEGPAWHFHPIRFSDKSLYLKFKDRPVWESLRQGHGSEEPNTEDPHYRILSSQRLSPKSFEKFSTSTTDEKTSP
jgi:hypothetical protein